MDFINRLEIIDHTSTNKGDGRAFVKQDKQAFDMALRFQDDGRTLKIFLTDGKAELTTDKLKEMS